MHTATQVATFRKLATDFADVYRQVRPCGRLDYVREDWTARNDDLERHLLPVPPADFLRHPAIRYQMFVDERIVPHELPYLRAHLDDDGLLVEDPVGEPPTLPMGPGATVTSSNTIHQLFHLMRYEEATGHRLCDIDTVVEWGGGFGSLMRLLVRRHGRQPTCVVIDTPLFSTIQWLYLSSVLGEDAVVLHHRGPVQPAEGLINIVPIGLADQIDVEADLFISNWALNESTGAAQNDVLARRWFGAQALLLAMHAGDPFTDIAVRNGARPIPVGDFMPGQQYLVA